jgi:hypothetical protein
MQMHHAGFARSATLRTSLRRGLARQAIVMAGRKTADFRALFDMASSLRPNRKGLERMAERLKAQQGVVRVALGAEGKTLVYTARALRDVEARVEGETAFCETGLIYLQVRVGLQGGCILFRLRAVGFCQHALERLVERSSVPLDSALLPHVDAEAVAIFRHWSRAALIVDQDDHFYPAGTAGVWAGAHDAMGFDSDWPLVTETAPTVPLFSARTFLSEAEMRPTVFLRWKDDPACQLL